MPDPQLPNLAHCLAAASWRRLLAIMACHGLPCSTRWRKADLLAALQAHLGDPAAWRRLIPELAAPARSALAALLQAGGALPAPTFTATFGAVRPHRPWRDAPPAPAPWLAPASPAERLWYLGLIYLVPPAPDPGALQRVLIAAELLPILQPLLLTPEADQPIHLLPRPGRPADLAWHVALLLASAEAAPLAPIRGRWLPPSLIADLAGRTGLEPVAGAGWPRSEHRLPYLAFLHLLAEAADLLSGPTRFAITAAGWQWLAAPTAQRWATLWAAWLAAPVELTRGYRFPWANVMPAGRSLILDQFRTGGLAHYRPLQQIVAAVHLQDPHGYLAQPWGVRQDVAAALVAGPLFWFGAVDLALSPAEDAPVAQPDLDADWQLDDDANWPDWFDNAASPAPRLADLDLNLDLDPSLRPVIIPFGDSDRAATAAIAEEHAPHRPATVPPRLVRLNLTGAWLLGLPDCAAPDFPAPAACSSDAGEPDLLHVPAAAPLHLARLAPLADWLPPAPPAMTQPLRLTAPAVGQAIARGMSLAQLLDHLAQALDRPPSRRQLQRLRQWAAAGQQVRIRHLTVLETADPALLGQLRSRKLIRRHLGDAISPTRAILDPAAVPSVIQHLTTLGLYAGVEAAAAAGLADSSTAAPPPTPAAEEDLAAASPAAALYRNPPDCPPAAAPIRPGCHLDPAAGGLLYTAGLVYRGLAEHLSLPAPLAATVLDDLAGQLDARQREAAEHAAHRALEALAAALRGYLGLPAWQAAQEQTDPLPLIEQALARQQDLRLTYWGAGREQAVVRRVTPYWVERRQAIPYLIGYCHLREAERVFRLDRIVECQLVPRPAAEHED